MGCNLTKYLFCLSLSLSLLVLAGCSRFEQNQAENSYQKAQTSQDSQLILAALNTLVKIDPATYQSKLNSAQMAISQLKKAQSYMAEGDFYLAYLASHESYRALPTKKSKAILIKAGIKLRYLVDVNTRLFKHLNPCRKKYLVSY